jgi:hypothetical protein
VNLTEVRQERLSAGKVSVPYECSGMNIAFDAVTCHKHDLILRSLAEIVAAIGGDGNNTSVTRLRFRILFANSTIADHRASLILQPRTMVESVAPRAFADTITQS